MIKSLSVEMKGPPASCSLIQYVCVFTSHICHLLDVCAATIFCTQENVNLTPSPTVYLNTETLR